MPLMPPIPYLALEYLHFLPAPNTSLIPPDVPPPLMTSMLPTSPQTFQCPLMPPIPLLAPEYLHSLPAPNTPLTSSQHSPNCS